MLDRDAATQDLLFLAEEVVEVAADVDRLRERVTELCTEAGAPRIEVTLLELEAVAKADAPLEGTRGRRLVSRGRTSEQGESACTHE